MEEEIQKLVRKISSRNAQLFDLTEKVLTNQGTQKSDDFSQTVVNEKHKMLSEIEDLKRNLYSLVAERDRLKEEARTLRLKLAVNASSATTLSSPLTTAHASEAQKRILLESLQSTNISQKQRIQELEDALSHSLAERRDLLERLARAETQRDHASSEAADAAEVSVSRLDLERKRLAEALQQAADAQSEKREALLRCEEEKKLLRDRVSELESALQSYDDENLSISQRHSAAVQREMQVLHRNFERALSAKQDEINRLLDASMLLPKSQEYVVNERPAVAFDMATFENLASRVASEWQGLLQQLREDCVE